MKLYIELTSSQIIIGKLKNTFTKYKLINKQNIKLTSNELFENKIFNISKIYLLIKKYLNDNKINNAKVIISLPNIEEISNLKLDLFILQISLLMNKLDLKINTIINKKILKRGNIMPYRFFFVKKEIKKELNFFQKLSPPKKTSTKSWILMSIFLSISYILFFYNIQNEKRLKLEQLSQTNHKLSTELQVLNQKLHKKKQIQTKNNSIKEKIEKISKLKINTNNPNEILKEISDKIPNDCKLTEMKIDKNGKKSKKLTLIGQTSEQDSINKFIKKIRLNPIFANPHINNIQKITKNSEKSEYIFNISYKIKH